MLLSKTKNSQVRSRVIPDINTNRATQQTKLNSIAENREKITTTPDETEEWAKVIEIVLWAGISVWTVLFLFFVILCWHLRWVEILSLGFDVKICSYVDFRDSCANVCLFPMFKNFCDMHVFYILLEMIYLPGNDLFWWLMVRPARQNGVLLYMLGVLVNILPYLKRFSF